MTRATAMNPRPAVMASDQVCVRPTESCAPPRPASAPPSTMAVSCNSAGFRPGGERHRGVLAYGPEAQPPPGVPEDEPDEGAEGIGRVGQYVLPEQRLAQDRNAGQAGDGDGVKAVDDAVNIVAGRRRRLPRRRRASAPGRWASWLVSR